MGNFENTKLEWNDGKLDLDLIQRYYQYKTRKQYPSQNKSDCNSNRQTF